MNNIEIAKQTIQITEKGVYEVNGKSIRLPDIDYSRAEVYAPERSADMLSEDIAGYFVSEKCSYSVVNKDSFQASAELDNPCVLNFANAHFAGGGFLLGANAQEEALCRCSTLYASLTSENASEVYRFNNTRIRMTESDYMIFTPKVCVFRNEKYDLLEEPFMTSVITAAAPNRRGAAILATSKHIRETMLRRIRILLRIAAEHGHRDIVLGAWGCGAFGNDPVKVAEYFRIVLEDESYGRCFENVCFAVYGNTESKNFIAFSNVFGK